MQYHPQPPYMTLMDAGPKFYVVRSPTPVHDFKVKAMDLEFFVLKFRV